MEVVRVETATGRCRRVLPETTRVGAPTRSEERGLSVPLSQRQDSHAALHLLPQHLLGLIRVFTPQLKALLALALSLPAGTDFDTYILGLCELHYTELNDSYNRGANDARSESSNMEVLEAMNELHDVQIAQPQSLGNTTSDAHVMVRL